MTYKNSQVRKYCIEYNDDLYVFYLTKEVAIGDAPIIIAYLQQFRPILASKREVKNGKMPWYSLNWARNPEIFEANEKIVNSRRAKTNTFALETRQYYEQSDMMITIIKEQWKQEYSTKYILALLNSKPYYLWLRYKGKVKGNMLELYGAPLEEIPIIQAERQIKNKIEKIVDQIIEQPTNDELLHKIDLCIYDALNLSKKEIDLLEKMQFDFDK